MTRNPFLDPAKEIQQGKSDEEILARWQGERESGDDGNAGASGDGSTLEGYAADCFIHIPASEFDGIQYLPGYEFLTHGGLYVTKRKIHTDDAVRKAADFAGVLGLDGRQDGLLLDNITWHEARAITNALRGMMLTPAMYWAVYASLAGSKDKDSQELREDMSLRDEEWLDGIIRIEKILGGLAVSTKLLYRDMTRPVPDAAREYSGWFDLVNLDLRSGLPSSFTEAGSHRYGKPGLEGDHALARCVYRKGDLDGFDQQGPNIWLKAWDRPEDRLPGRGVRLCLTAEAYNKRAEGGHTPKPLPFAGGTSLR